MRSKSLMENTGTQQAPTPQKPKNKKKIIYISIISVLCAVLVIGLVFNIMNSKKSEPISSITPTATATNTDDPAPERTVDYSTEKALNADYAGHLFFDSGLVDQLTVQSYDNEYYLRRAFDGSDYSSGTVFMDYRNTLDDQNIIFYGHYVYADESLMFSPLTNLVDQANYEGNKTFELELENETRTYEVAYVYHYEMDNPDMEYWHTSYDQSELDAYLNYIKTKEFYDTGESISASDHFVTLQTCVRDRDDLRLIVIGKEVKRRTYAQE